MPDATPRPAGKKRFVTLATAAVIFAVPMTLYFGATSGRWLLAVALGAGGGVAFGAFMALFAGRAARGDRKLFGDVPANPPGEEVLREGPANHFRGIESVGGKLFLTPKRLRFVSHRLNIQVHDTSWPLEEIVGVEATRTLFVIPNGLRVTLQSGERERFVVYERRAWVEAIEAARAR